MVERKMTQRAQQSRDSPPLAWTLDGAEVLGDLSCEIHVAISFVTLRHLKTFYPVAANLAKAWYWYSLENFLFTPLL
jgi:hypothetical protein